MSYYQYFKQAENIKILACAEIIYKCKAKNNLDFYLYVFNTLINKFI